MAQSKFTQQVANEIKNYFAALSEKPVLFSNELHLQMHLSNYLMQQCGHSLLFEYRVPTERLKGSYPWRNKEGKSQMMYVDLVVYNEKEYIPIEIKYKTRGFVADYLVFSHPEKEMSVLKEQEAQDLGMYGFWKDVHRVEMIRDTYPAVKNGIALFVTNDPYYCNRKDSDIKSPDVNYYAFRMTEGRIASGELCWTKATSEIANENPGFELSGEHKIHWEPIGRHETPRQRTDFSYCMVII